MLTSYFLLLDSALCIRFLDPAQANGILKAREFSISKIKFYATSEDWG